MYVCLCLLSHRYNPPFEDQRYTSQFDIRKFYFIEFLWKIFHMNIFIMEDSYHKYVYKSLMAINGILHKQLELFKMILNIQNYYFKEPERISLFPRQIQFNIQINSKAISKVNIVFIIPFLFPFLPFF